MWPLVKSEVGLLRQQLKDELEHTSELRKEKELLKEKLLALAAQNDALVSDNKSLSNQLQHRFFNRLKLFSATKFVYHRNRDVLF